MRDMRLHPPAHLILKWRYELKTEDPQTDSDPAQNQAQQQNALSALGANTVSKTEFEALKQKWAVKNEQQ